MIRFKNYLNEAFNPNLQFEWGDNKPECNDQTFNKTLAGYYTNFIQNNIIFRVQIVIFDENYYGSGNIFELNFDTLSDETRRYQRIDVGNAIYEILNKVFVIAKYAYDRYPIAGFFISGWSDDLTQIYNKIIQTKNFQKLINQLGFVSVKDTVTTNSGFFIIGKEYYNDQI